MASAYTIVGVMPARFSIKSWGISAQELWVPLAYSDAERAVRDNHNDAVVARLKPGVTLAQAQSEMNVISTRLEQQFPQTNAGWGATIVPLQELIVGDVRLSLLMLLAAVGLVLLIACANVGNLLFARVLARRKELAIRSALGAGRGRVFQQLLVEALVLSMAGGTAGLLLARASLEHRCGAVGWPGAARRRNLDRRARAVVRGRHVDRYGHPRRVRCRRFARAGRASTTH